MQSLPKVTVCVLTYNQVKYISTCLQSIIEQQTNFDFEVIVGDDCSNDGTTAIVKEFEARFPQLIEALIQPKNIGGFGNLLAIYKLARGSYIAHIDGDDIMCRGKLQAQYEALIGNPTCVMCTHDMMVVDKDGEMLSRSFQRHSEGEFTINELYRHLPFFAHSSKMFVNRLDLSKTWNYEPIDIEIHIEQARSGNIYHLDQPLGVYRAGVGVSTVHQCVNPLLPSATRRIYESALNERLGSNQVLEMRSYFAKAILNYSYQSALVGSRDDCRKYAEESMRIRVISFSQFTLYCASFLPSYLLMAFSQSRRYIREKFIFLRCWLNGS